MPIVNANFPTNLFVPAAVTPSSETTVGAPVSLRPEQMVQAFVVEVENDRTVLEIGSQRYQVLGKSELQVGEKLSLQVQQVAPRLEFRVLDNLVNNRLAQTLPSLSQPFDWGELVVRLQPLAIEGRLPSSVVTVLNQLEGILISPGQSEFKEQLAKIASQLRQLSDPEPELFRNSQTASVPTVSSSMQSSQISAGTELLQAIVSLVKNLQNQLSQVPRQQAEDSAQDFSTEIKDILAAHSSGRDASQLKRMVLPVLDQIRQSPDLSPRVIAEIQRILSEVDTQNSQRVAAVAGEKVSDATSRGGGLSLPLPVADSGNTEWQKVSTEIRDLLGKISQLQKRGISTPSDLLGRLEGLKQHLQTVEETARSLPDIEILIGQVNQLISQPTTILSGEKLGILSQLFGFHFEADLLDGKKKPALASLKSCLLELQREGDDVREPLRRLELFQLCKAKLADNHIQFMPLPFSELEEGYMLAEKHGETDKPGCEKAPVQMSLSLRLSALGNVRIDILYASDGLYLRMAGEDRYKMDYLKRCREELEEVLQAVDLRGVSFSADAGLPAQQLQERLLPEFLNMFDARI